MNFNENKNYIADGNRLTKSEKRRLAKDLLELECQGILEYRDGRWGFAPGVEIEETPDGPVVRVHRQHDVVPGKLAASSVASSGEPSETRVPPLEQAARPESQGPGSPDSDDEVNKNKQ